MRQHYRALTRSETAQPLLSNVSHTYAADADSSTSAFDEQIRPEWLVDLFAEAIGMSSENGDVAWLRLGLSAGIYC